MIILAHGSRVWKAKSVAAAPGEGFVLLQPMTENGTAKEEELLLQTIPARKPRIHSEGQTPPAATQPPQSWHTKDLRFHT